MTTTNYIVDNAQFLADIEKEEAARLSSVPKSDMKSAEELSKKRLLTFTPALRGEVNAKCVENFFHALDEEYLHTCDVVAGKYGAPEDEKLVEDELSDKEGRLLRHISFLVGKKAVRAYGRGTPKIKEDETGMYLPRSFHYNSATIEFDDGALLCLHR